MCADSSDQENSKGGDASTSHNSSNLPNHRDPKERGIRERVIKTSMCSFRIDRGLKDKLRVTAALRGLSMSSLVAMILRNALESPDDHVHPVQKLSMREDRRRYPRKKVTLPARWSIEEGENVMEYDVILRDISVGGAYTEYADGQGFRILENLQISPFAMVVRLPGEQHQAVLPCQAKYFHITQEIVGVGLHFSKMMKEENMAVLARYLS